MIRRRRESIKYVKETLYIIYICLKQTSLWICGKWKQWQLHCQPYVFWNITNYAAFNFFLKGFMNCNIHIQFIFSDYVIIIIILCSWYININGMYNICRPRILKCGFNILQGLKRFCSGRKCRIGVAPVSTKSERKWLLGNKQAWLKDPRRDKA